MTSLSNGELKLVSGYSKSERVGGPAPRESNRPARNDKLCFGPMEHLAECFDHAACWVEALKKMWHMPLETYGKKQGQHYVQAEGAQDEPELVALLETMQPPVLAHHEGYGHVLGNHPTILGTNERLNVEEGRKDLVTAWVHRRAYQESISATCEKQWQINEDVRKTELGRLEVAGAQSAETGVTSQELSGIG